ncbi:MAG TPA: hypothetical protein VM509_14035 [Planctomycetota bacterium]|nr:hypothetical protein [Planctomycetota bacterium]
MPRLRRARGRRLRRGGSFESRTNRRSAAITTISAISAISAITTVAAVATISTISAIATVRAFAPFRTSASVEAAISAAAAGVLGRPVAALGRAIALLRRTLLASTSVEAAISAAASAVLDRPIATLGRTIPVLAAFGASSAIEIASRRTRFAACIALAASKPAAGRGFVVEGGRPLLDLRRARHGAMHRMSLLRPAAVAIAVSPAARSAPAAAFATAVRTASRIRAGADRARFAFALDGVASALAEALLLHHAFALARLRPGFRRALAHRAAMTASAVAVAGMLAPPAASARIHLDAVVAGLADLQELDRDLLREEQRLAIVEIDAFLPRVERVHRDHDVVATRAPPTFLRVVRRQREVQEAPPSTAQAVAHRAVRVARRDADVQHFGRTRRLAGLDVDRMPVERAHACADDLVTRPVAGMDRILEVSHRDRLAEAFVQGLDDAFGVAVALGVELEVELLGLVAEHVGERACDAFDQGGVGHSAQLKDRSMCEFVLRKTKFGPGIGAANSKGASPSCQCLGPGSTPRDRNQQRLRGIAGRAKV